MLSGFMNLRKHVSKAKSSNHDFFPKGYIDEFCSNDPNTNNREILDWRKIFVRFFSKDYSGL